MVAIEHQAIQMYLVRPRWKAWDYDTRGILPVRCMKTLHCTINAVNFCRSIKGP